MSSIKIRPSKAAGRKRLTGTAMPKLHPSLPDKPSGSAPPVFLDNLPRFPPACPQTQDVGMQSASEAQESVATKSLVIQEYPTTFLPETLPHLLSLPPELFDLVCDHFLPRDDPIYNRYEYFEFERKFRRRRITKNFINLAVTSKSAYGQCLGTFASRSKSLQLSAEQFWKRTGHASEQGDRLDRLCRELESPFSRQVEYVPTRLT